MLTVMAPAKLNLTLEVLGERRSGFHEICSVIQTVSLCDTLKFSSSQDIELECDKPDWIAERSLIPKTISLLQDVTGCSRGVTIEINKRIPLVSGLGGDSSCAAATMRGLNELWGLELSAPELGSIAPRLGSDVAFFLYGGTALLQGQGEIVAPLPPLPHMWVVLLVPPMPRTYGKTGQLYASLEIGHYTQGEVTERLLALLTHGEVTASSIPLFNVFDGVAAKSFIGLERYWEYFVQAGAQEVHLAGSGPALFAIFDDKAQAETIYKSLGQSGLESYLVETLSTLGEAG